MVIVVVGGEYDDSEGYFVCFMVLFFDDLIDELFVIEYFGLLLLVYVYFDECYE